MRKKTNIGIIALILSIFLTACAGGKDTSGRNPVREPVRIPVNGSVDSVQSEAESTVGVTDDTSIVISDYSSRGQEPYPTQSVSQVSSNSVSSSSAVTQETVLKSFTPNQKLTERLSFETSSLNLSTKGLGKIRIKLKNSSSAMAINIYFITKGDPHYNSAKSVKLNIDFHTDSSKEYIADLSACYGFTGTLDKIKVESSVIYDGSMTLEKLEILQGGSLNYPFTLSEKKIVATRAEIAATSSNNGSAFPDGVMGIIKNANGTYDFLSSGPWGGEGGMKAVTIYNGTLDKPTQKLVTEGVSVQNTPNGRGYNQFEYASAGQLYHIAGSEYLSIIHLERHFNENGESTSNGNRPTGKVKNQYFLASLALGYSPDNGRTWYYAGEIATHECESIDPYYGMNNKKPATFGDKVYSRDIGNGPFIIKDGYIMVYYIDVDASYTQKMSVMRAKLSDVIAAARAKSTARQTNLFKKYYQGSFSQPAFGGKADTIVDDACPPNFMTIIYSTYLKQYILARCSSPQYSSNDGDIVMNISADPLNFKGNNYYIDTDTTGQQYPTLVGDGENPGFTTGKKVYLYYIDANSDPNVFLWDKANIARRIITFD